MIQNHEHQAIEQLKQLRAEEILHVAESEDIDEVEKIQRDPSRGCPGLEQLDYSLYEQIAIAAKDWTVDK